ncbi:hypothetical protein MUK42_26696 [Musa troglodytarum]|uniref:DUF668 domain-containing protein n=1 Tax=Musa troglodytarum TaxID=320322 RepID=A0A9E7EZ59_9LILI|nr:hypothetical protein MUK42_26696 [Musa troglodytarum]
MVLKPQMEGRREERGETQVTTLFISLPIKGKRTQSCKRRKTVRDGKKNREEEFDRDFLPPFCANAINFMVSRSNSVPSNTRDSLYQGLPPTMKNAFRCRLQSFQIKEEIPVPQIKAEMEKSLRWLVPIANNTTKSEVNRKPGGSVDLIRVETLYHADKEKTEAYILNLLLWLHHHISRSKSSGGGIKSPVCSPTREGLTITSLSAKPSPPSSVLSQEDEEMLQYVNFRKLIPGISKSQEFDTTKSKSGRHNRLSKSNSHSPASCTRKDFFAGARRPSMLPVIDFNIDRVKALDVIDRVDDIRKP